MSPHKIKFCAKLDGHAGMYSAILRSHSAKCKYKDRPSLKNIRTVDDKKVNPIIVDHLQRA